MCYATLIVMAQVYTQTWRRCCVCWSHVSIDGVCCLFACAEPVCAHVYNAIKIHPTPAVPIGQPMIEKIHKYHSSAQHNINKPFKIQLSLVLYWTHLRTVGLVLLVAYYMWSVRILSRWGFLSYLHISHISYRNQSSQWINQKVCVYFITVSQVDSARDPNPKPKNLKMAGKTTLFLLVALCVFWAEMAASNPVIGKKAGK